ncbi:DUF4397 domain-containing protein [bacterium]|nr:MAG: DUF4397 domain-containing protein [bacterium]
MRMDFDLPTKAPNLFEESRMKNFWKVITCLGLAMTTSLPAHAVGRDAFVRVVHAVTDGSKVDVFVDGDKKWNDVEFSGVTKYIRVPRGTHNIRIETNNPSRTLVNTTRSFRDGYFYTVGAYGTPSRPRTFSHDDSSGAIPYDHSTITFFNLATGGPTFDARATISQNGDMLRIVRGVRYGQAKVAVTPALPQSLRLLSGSRTLKTLTGAKPRAGRKYAAFVVGRVERNYRVILVNAASQ